MSSNPWRTTTIAAAAAIIPVSLLAAATVATASPAAARSVPGPELHVRQLVNGMNLSHTFTPAGGSGTQSEPLTGPDDITMLGRDLFTGFQNGVGAQGEPSPDGNTASTVVEFTATGMVAHQWDIIGKCDGLTADPHTGKLIATVNEDGNSSVYTIAPNAAAATQVQHYTYNEPLPHNGGTDAISVMSDGQVLVSASAPGTTGSPAPQPTYPAVYRVRFDAATSVATVKPLFYDESSAFTASTGARVKLALTDPDSSAVVPASAPRFGGDYVLDSQGDLEEIFVLPSHARVVLGLEASVDDSAWATSPSGNLYGSDSTHDTIDVVSGSFAAGAAYAAVTPCNANNAPSTCPAPGFPANYLGIMNVWTGHLTRIHLVGPDFQPKGLIFAPGANR